MENAYGAVSEVLKNYFDGLYRGDVQMLEGVFAPQARLACATEGFLACLTIDEYLPIVASREPPMARNEVRRDEIVSLAFAGPVTCAARVRCAIGEKYFTDLLTLVRIDGAWRIISKVYHFDLLPVDQTR